MKNIYAILLIVLIFSNAWTLFNYIDLSVSNSYMQDGYKMTEGDLETTIQIFNSGDFPKANVLKILDEKGYYTNGASNEFKLNFLTLKFTNDRLKTIER